MTHRVGQQRGVSRRTVLRELAGLAVVGITGGSLVWLTHVQESHVSTFLPNATPSAVAAQSITSSGMMFGVDPQHSHVNPGEHFLLPTNVSHLRPYWTASTGGVIESSPAVVNGVVYVGSGDSKLYAFNASTGNALWSANIGGPIRYSTAEVKDVVYDGW